MRTRTRPRNRTRAKHDCRARIPNRESLAGARELFRLAGARSAAADRDERTVFSRMSLLMMRDVAKTPESLDLDAPPRWYARSIQCSTSSPSLPPGNSCTRLLCISYLSAHQFMARRSVARGCFASATFPLTNSWQGDQFEEAIVVDDGFDIGCGFVRSGRR